MQLTRTELEALRSFDTPTLANAVEGLGIRAFTDGYASSQIRCILPELPRLVGYAATATITAGIPADPEESAAAMQALYAHVRSLPEPRVVVIKDLDSPGSHGSLWGEVNATIFHALGCEGVVTDGVVRDLPEVRAVGFRLFAAGVGVSHAYVTVREVGVDVEVGGLVVAPGDILHADVHGVLSIPAGSARDLPAAAEAVIAREQRLLSWVRSNAFDPDQLSQMQAVH